MRKHALKHKHGDINLSLVSFVKVQNSDQLMQAIPDALDLIQYQLPKRVSNIVIKPNMCYYWDYTTGETTHPKFVTTLIELIRNQTSSNVDISIVESDASAMKCKQAFKFLGYEKIAKEHHVNLVNLSEAEAEPVKVEVGNQSFNFMVPKIIKNADLRINIPKIKYMELSKISCALKNIYGCNPYPKKFKYHPRLSETIVALNKIMRFDLSILDGLIVSGSQVSKLGLIMASRDPVAMDAAAATIMRVNPKSVKHIRLAEKEGIGKTSFTAKGTNLNYFKERYPQKSLADKTITLGYKLVCALGLDKRLFL
jgi:uncharacterized protein (DUF362 family)